MKVAIVGSRRRRTLKDRQIVFDLVRDLVEWARTAGDEVVIVSGGCPKGADAFAEEAAKVFGLQKKIFPIDRFTPISNKWEFVQRAFGRNRSVAEYADVMYALVHSDRKGGTENTIQYSVDLKKFTYTVDDDGNAYLVNASQKIDKTRAP